MNKPALCEDEIIFPVEELGQILKLRQIFDIEETIKELDKANVFTQQEFIQINNILKNAARRVGSIK
jgi:hypothetical protein